MAVTTPGHLGLPVLAPARLTGLACLILLIAGSAARAQSIDYGALESLFDEPVTTSVTGSPQRASQVPASMTIITQDEIRRSGARDIPGVLAHVPGINTLQWTNDQSDVAIRGYNQAYSPRVLVLIDGRQVYADYYGFTPWSTLPVELSDIRQIEIVEGPNSALFGFNAVGGVINIVTYDPLYDDVNTASITGGTQNLVQGSGVATFRMGETAGLRVSLGGRGNDDFSTPQNPVDIGTRQGDTRRSIDIVGHAQLSPTVDARLEVSHTETRQPEIIPLYTGFYTRHRTNSVNASLSADTGIGLLNLTAFGNWLRGVSKSSSPFAPPYIIESDLYAAQARDIFKLGRNHTIRLSAEYRHSSLATTPLTGATVFYDVFAGGAMWNWAIEPNLSLTNAVRLDSLSLGRTGAMLPGFGLTNAAWDGRSLTATSFNSGLVWQPDPDDTLRATLARGVQLPSLLDLGGLLIAAPPFGYVSGVPTIDPTIVMNYELAWDRKLPQWHATLRVRLFHQTTRDITANTGGALYPLGIVATPTNIGRSKASGLEILLDGTLAEDWRWGLSYTPETISDNFAPGFNATTVLVDYEHTHPVHTVKANLGWTHGSWAIDGYLRYLSEFDSIRGSSTFVPVATLVRIPDYVTMDARIAWRLTDQLTLAVSGQNLLDSPQAQTSSAKVERTVQATLTADF